MSRHHAAYVVEKKLASPTSPAERRAMIEPGRAERPVTVQSQLLSISRASLYYRAAGPSVFAIAVQHKEAVSRPDYRSPAGLA